MDPFTIGALISGGTALVGGLLSNKGAREANAQNAQQAAENRHFQDVMSTTAHTREVADLKNAGLNPILSAGAGASTPPGSMATAQNTMEGASASAMEALQMFQTIKKQKSEIDLMEAQTNKTRTEAKVLSKDIPKADMVNELYDTFGKPIIHKIKEMRNDAASTWREFKKDNSQSNKSTGRGLKLGPLK